MKISLKVSMLVACVDDERIFEVCREAKHREPNQRVVVESSELTKAEIAKIVKASETDNRALHRRLKLWDELKATPDSAKIRKSAELETALIVYIGASANRYVFVQDEDGNMLPYFVDGITWTKARRNRDGTIDPAYTRMSMVGYLREDKVACSQSWSDRVLDGTKTVSELLEEHNIFLETPDFTARWQQEMERFKQLYRTTGAQYLAAGLGYPDKKDRWSSSSVEALTRDGKPSRVVMDYYGDKGENDADEEKEVEEGTMTDDFWPEQMTKEQKDKKKAEKVAREDDEGEEIEDDNEVVLPCHPYVKVFDFGRDTFATCHINCLAPYEFQTGIGEKLILPSDVKELVTTLIATATNMLEDIIDGKTGGTIVLSSGHAGTGKTLTAEVFAEQMKIPIYAVQCSQLGIDAAELESALLVILGRAMRWKALLLLDEADVYVRERGDDLTQNAIVGVFLRLLERYRGILFMTSNRATMIDDAVLSRCIAHIRYSLPDADASTLIWQVLSENYEVDLFPKEIADLVGAYPLISGRNIKTLLKLATSVSKKNPDDFKAGELSGLIHKVAPFVDFPKEHYACLTERKGAKK